MLKLDSTSYVIYPSTVILQIRKLRLEELNDNLGFGVKEI